MTFPFLLLLATTTTTHYTPLQAWAGTGSVLAWRVTPYVSASQTLSDLTINSLGNYVGWAPLVPDVTCASGLRYSEQRFEGGTPCGALGGRKTNLKFSCSTDGNIRMSTTVIEGPTCTYNMSISIDCR